MNYISLAHPSTAASWSINMVYRMSHKSLCHFKLQYFPNCNKLLLALMVRAFFMIFFGIIMLNQTSNGTSFKCILERCNCLGTFLGQLIESTSTNLLNFMLICHSYLQKDLRNRKNVISFNLLLLSRERVSQLMLERQRNVATWMEDFDSSIRGKVEFRRFFMPSLMLSQQRRF